MAVTKASNSSILNKSPKYVSFLAGYPPKMAAPSATDGGTGTTANIAFTAVTGATGYRAISTPGSFTGTGTSSPISVDGLTAGTAYTFQIQAQNSAGYGAYSDASNSVTPVTPVSFESIATVNVTSNTSTITFSSIPSTYKHLQIRYLIADSVTAGNLIYTRFNNDSGSNYTGHVLYGNGTSASAGVSGGTSQTQWQNWATPNSGTSNPAAGIIDIHDYASTSKNKTARHIYGIPDSPNQYMVLQSGLWMSTSAINQIDFALFGGGQFGSGVKFALYGIKG